MSVFHQFQLGIGRPLVEVFIVLIELDPFEHASFSPIPGPIGSGTQHVLDLARGQ